MADDRSDKWMAVREHLAGQYEIDLPAIQKSAQRMVSQSNRPPKETFQEVFQPTDRPTTPRQVIPQLDTVDISGVPLDGRIESRLIEQNLDELARILDVCVTIRRDYGSAASAYLEAKIKLEEFFRLDEIHKLEVKAELYELPWKDSKDQLAALDLIIPELEASQKSVDNLLTEGVFKAANVNGYIETSIKLAAISVREADANAAGDLTRTLTAYRSTIERAQWSRVKVMGYCELEKIKAQRSIEDRRSRYLEQEVTFKQNRTGVARDLSYERLAYYYQLGGALNHAEMLQGIRALFQSFLPRLISRVNAVVKGMTDTYGLEIGAPDLSRGRIIERLSIWVAKAQDELALRRRSERLTVLSFSLNSLLSSNWRDMISKGAEFSLSPLVFASGGLLRGINIEIVGDASTPVVIQIGPMQPDGNWTTLSFGRPGSHSSGADLRPMFSDSVWNVPAAGKWYAKSIGKVHSGVDDVQLVIWVVNK